MERRIGVVSIFKEKWYTSQEMKGITKIRLLIFAKNLFIFKKKRRHVYFSSRGYFFRYLC